MTEKEPQLQANQKESGGQKEERLTNEPTKLEDITINDRKVEAMKKEEEKMIGEELPKLQSEIKDAFSGGNKEENQEPKEKSTKETEWEKTRKEVDEIGDRLGLGIDRGIKETITAFMVNKFPTSSSCEGHIDGGIPTPYVEVSAPNEPEERFIGQNEAFEKVAKKYNLTVEEAKRGKVMDAYWEAIKECARNEETDDYKKWDEENKKLQVNAEKLLEEFYQERKVEPNVKLQIEEIVGCFRIHNGGKDYDDLIDTNEEVSEERKGERAEKLVIYKKEMDDFTQFLKIKFFEEKSLNPEKEAEWKKFEEELEKVAGFDIEPEIKEPVIALNASGVNTTNSCEGHYNHGRITPWVSIGAWAEPREKYTGQKKFETELFVKNGVSEDWLENNQKYLNEFAEERDRMRVERLSKEKPFFDENESRELSEINSNLMEKYRITDEGIEKWMDVWRIMQENIEGAANKGILKEETEEYKKWNQENQKILDKASELLAEFYQDRNIPENVKIILYKSPEFGYFLRNEGGGDYVELDKKMTGKEKEDYEDILEGRVPEKKQEELKARIELYRVEFKKFAEFLKKKVF